MVFKMITLQEMSIILFLACTEQFVTFIYETLPFFKQTVSGKQMTYSNKKLTLKTCVYIYLVMKAARTGKCISNLPTQVQITYVETLYTPVWITPLQCCLNGPVYIHWSKSNCIFFVFSWQT